MTRLLQAIIPTYISIILCKCRTPTWLGVNRRSGNFCHYYEGQLAFSSWGEEGFWINEERPENPITDGPHIDEIQIPSGGAYLAMIRIWEPSSGPPYDTPEYEPNDLMQLLSIHDWRKESSSGVTTIPFYKWGVI